MGPFVFQVPVRPRLASVDDASGDGGLGRVVQRRSTDRLPFRARGDVVYRRRARSFVRLLSPGPLHLLPIDPRDRCRGSRRRAVAAGCRGGCDYSAEIVHGVWRRLPLVHRE